MKPDRAGAHMSGEANLSPSRLPASARKARRAVDAAKMHRVHGHNRNPSRLMVFDQCGIAELLGPVHLVFPERQGLNKDSGFLHYIDRDACHVDDGGRAVATLAFQDDGDIGVTVHPVIATARLPNSSPSIVGREMVDRPTL